MRLAFVSFCSPLAVASLLLLSACAGSRRESIMLTADTALISVLGSGPKDRTKVVESSIMEAPRVTREHGYRYFAILSASDASETRRKMVVENRLNNDKVGDGLPGNSSLPTLSSVYGNFLPESERVLYVRPGLDITIRMYREGEIDLAKMGAWDSENVLVMATQP